MSPHSPPDEAPSWFVIKVTAMASLGGCLFGYDMGAISGALPQLQETFDLTESQQEWVVSILYLGGGFGACVGGTLCDFLGRHRTILGTDLIFMIGAAWLFFANSYLQVLWGRFVVGIAVAVSGIADVSYLHEIAPLEWRGAIVSVNEACISLGFLLAYIAAYFYRGEGSSEEWRIIFGWAGVLALVQFAGMFNLPESPVWLAQQGRMEESRIAWQQINQADSNGNSGDSNADPASLQPETGELAHIPDTPWEEDPDETPDRLDVEGHNDERQSEEVVVSMASQGIRGVILSFFASVQGFFLTIRMYKRQVYIAIFLAVTQQFCGQTNVLNYAPHIFAEAAGADGPPAWSTVAIGLVKFVVTIFVIWKIEFIGRRTLLLSGMVCISIGLCALIVAFGGSLTDDPDSWKTNLQSFDLALPGVLLVVCGYSMSFGPLTWLLTSELFPTDIRGRALGASTILTYICASFVTRTFLSAQSMLGPSKVFAIYCMISTSGIVFAYLAIPDTGDKTVKQIEVALHQMWWWRYDSVALLSQMEEDGVQRESTPSYSTFSNRAGETNLESRDIIRNIELSSSHQNLQEIA